MYNKKYLLLNGGTIDDILLIKYKNYKIKIPFLTKKTNILQPTIGSNILSIS